VAVLLGAVVLPIASPTDAEPDHAGASSAVATDGSVSVSRPTTGPGRRALPAPFAGTVDEFYVVPDPLPAGARGEIIRRQAIDAGGSRTGWRVMHHTVDQAGNDRAVTGIITVPNAPAPDEGWPVVAHAHGTTGIVSRCAPSRGPSLPGDVGIPGVFAQTDYIGLGPVGEFHPYLQRAAEANAVLDSVRAAHEIAGPDLNDDWYLIGASQGGHAALAAYEDAVTELPELDLRGTVALVPGGEVSGTFDDVVQVQILAALILFGNQDEEDGIDLEAVFTPEAFAALEEPMTQGCLDGVIVAAVPFALTQTMFREPLDAIPEVVAWRERNEVARVRGASPILVVGGVRDITVVIARVRALRDSLCAIGQPLTYLEVPEGDHGSAGVLSAPQWRAWLQDRAAGAPLDSDCPDVPTTTTSTTSSTSTTTSSTSTTAGTSTSSTTSSTPTTSIESTTTTTSGRGGGSVSGAGTVRPPVAPGASPRRGVVTYTG
jgi:hypothetical protein